MLDKLEKKYNRIGIANVEKVIDNFKASEAKFYRDRILVLYYLERTGRYKENKIYKHASFSAYIFDRHAMRIGTYNSHRIAIFNSLVHVERYGIGVVKKVYTYCGVANAPHVFVEIDKAKVKTRTEIENIIRKHSKPKQSKAAGPTISQLQNELIDKEQTIIDQKKIIKNQADQIKKLKRTIKNLKSSLK